MDLIDKNEPRSSAKFQCTICAKSFVYGSSLEEHILNKHVDNKKFQCSQCYETNQLVKSFATQNILNKHIKRVHVPPRFKCHVCFKTFKDTSNFARHKRCHSQTNLMTHKCALCPAAYRFKHKFQIHLFNAHKQKQEDVIYLKCELCSREFLHRSELELHVVRQHVVDKAFECPVCSKTFIDQETLEKHMTRHDRQNKYFCHVCSKGFTLKKGLVNHLGVTHNHFFYCDKCLNSYNNRSNFDAHISDSDPKLKCYICQELINSKCNLKIHTDSHVKEIKTDINEINTETQSKAETVTKCTSQPSKEINVEKLQCDICSQAFDRETYFRAHRNLVHPNAEWKCNFDKCFKIFKMYNQLKLHKMEHAETKPFACNICQKSFYRPDYLKDHEQVHLKEKKFKCEICPKSWTTPSALRIHIANNHGGVKPFKCPVVSCDTSWASNSQLKVHLVSHQTERSFECKICLPFKAFKTLKNLVYHQRQVHNSDAKKIKALKSQKIRKNWKLSDAVVFKCSSNECSFETRNEKDVALHYSEQHQLPKVLIMENSSSLTLSPFMPRNFETIRMIQKRFSCIICRKYFECSSSFYQHQNRFHADHKQVHVKEKKYKCEICSKSFPAPSKLQNHIGNHHGGPKPFKCPVVNCDTC